MKILPFLLFAGLAYGQVASIGDTIGDYKGELEKANELFKGVGNSSTYQKYQFKNKKTGETRKFEDFSDFEKRIFISLKKLELESNLKALQNQWVANFRELNKSPDKGDSKEPDTAIAKSSHVGEALTKLFDLRKLVASDTERDLEQLFTNFPEKFSQKEKEFILKQLKESHDKEKLADR